MTSVAVDPDMRFYNLLETYPYTPTTALCEFIDNSLQAFVDAKELKLIADDEKLKINIHFNDEQSDTPFIVIRDYGVGIKESELQPALKPAFAKKEKSLSEFGIGMKASAIWFGRRWQLSSLSHIEDKEFKFDFDLDYMLDNGINEVQVNPSSGMKECGVEIKITKLRNEINKSHIDKVNLNLQETYQLFTKGPTPLLELTIEYNKTPITSDLELGDNFYDILKYPVAKPGRNLESTGNTLFTYGKDKEWKQDINFTFNGKRVYGFLSLLHTSSQKSNPGLRLFRFKRLIRGMHHAPYRPVDLVGTANKHAPSRVYGEIHLDGQPISNHKGDFQFDEPFFLETLKKEPGVSKLIDQAENYRVKMVNADNVTHFDTFEEYQTAIKNRKKAKKKTSNSGPKNPANSNPQQGVPAGPNSQQGKPTGPNPEQGKPAKPNPEQGKPASLNPEQDKPAGSNPEQGKPTVPAPVPPQPIDTLKNTVFPSDISLLHSICDSALEMYKLQKWWPFCLCYRVVLEVGIIEKLKRTNKEHYGKAYDWSIDRLLKHLSHNREDLIEKSKYKRLFNSLRDGGKVLQNIPGIAILNLAAHGNFEPTDHHADTLLNNTQDLLNWIAD